MIPLGVLASGVGRLVPEVGDDFARADSASSLGVTSLGGVAWTPRVGTWGISGGHAYSVSHADGDMATVPLGCWDQDVSVKLTTPSYSGLILRCKDAGNHVVLYTNGGWADMFARVGGGWARVAAVAHSEWNAGDTLRATLQGQAWAIYKNATLLGSGSTDVIMADGTDAGMRLGNNPTTTFDDFYAREAS